MSIMSMAYEATMLRMQVSEAKLAACGEGQDIAAQIRALGREP